MLLCEKSEGNEQERRKLIDTDNSMVITTGKRGRRVEECKAEINGDRRRLEVGW